MNPVSDRTLDLKIGALRDAVNGLTRATGYSKRPRELVIELGPDRFEVRSPQGGFRPEDLVMRAALQALPSFYCRATLSPSGTIRAWGFSLCAGKHLAGRAVRIHFAAEWFQPHRAISLDVYPKEVTSDNSLNVTPEAIITLHPEYKLSAPRNASWYLSRIDPSQSSDTAEISLRDGSFIIPLCEGRGADYFNRLIGESLSREPFVVLSMPVLSPPRRLLLGFDVQLSAELIALGAAKVRAKFTREHTGWSLQEFQSYTKNGTLIQERHCANATQENHGLCQLPLDALVQQVNNEAADSAHVRVALTVGSSTWELCVLSGPRGLSMSQVLLLERLSQFEKFSVRGVVNKKGDLPMVGRAFPIGKMFADYSAEVTGALDAKKDIDLSISSFSVNIFAKGRNDQVEFSFRNISGRRCHIATTLPVEELIARLQAERSAHSPSCWLVINGISFGLSLENPLSDRSKLLYRCLVAKLGELPYLEVHLEPNCPNTSSILGVSLPRAATFLGSTGSGLRLAVESGLPRVL